MYVDAYFQIRFKQLEHYNYILYMLYIRLLYGTMSIKLFESFLLYFIINTRLSLLYHRNIIILLNCYYLTF